MRAAGAADAAGDVLRALLALGYSEREAAAAARAGASRKRRIGRDPDRPKIACESLSSPANVNDKESQVNDERLITAPAASPNEEAVERALRPQRLAEYVGQQRIREQFEIFIQAARGRAEALDHVLLFGPPGLARPRSHTSSAPRMHV